MSSARHPTPADLHSGGALGVTASTEDPIVEDVRRVRDTLAKAHGNDIRAIASALREQQREHAELVVRREPKRLQTS